MLPATQNALELVSHREVLSSSILLTIIMVLSIGGYMGKLLRVELTRNKIYEEDLKEEFVKKYIGGYGTAARILYEVPPWAGALTTNLSLVALVLGSTFYPGSIYQRGKRLVQA